MIQTERVGEFVIDAGPDSLLVQKPAAVALCNEIGLGDRLFPTKPPAHGVHPARRHAARASRRVGARLPHPRPADAAQHAVLARRRKLRMGAELFMPRRRADRR